MSWNSPHHESRKLPFSHVLWKPAASASVCSTMPFWFRCYNIHPAQIILKMMLDACIQRTFCKLQFGGNPKKPVKPLNIRVEAVFLLHMSKVPLKIEILSFLAISLIDAALKSTSTEVQTLDIKSQSLSSVTFELDLIFITSLFLLQFPK